MSENEATASGPIARLKQLSAQYFVDREVFLRSNDKVRYLRLSARAQKLMAGAAAVTAGWLVYTTLAFFLSTYLERAKDAEITQHRLAYFDLLSEVSEYHGQFAQITHNLQENQGYLLSLLNSDQVVGEGLGDNLKDNQTEYARVAVARDALRDRLKTFEIELQQIASKNGDLQLKVASLKNTLQTTEAERQAVAAAREKLGRRLEETEQQLATTSATKSDLESTVRSLIAELERERALSDQLISVRAELESELSGQRASYEATIAAQTEEYETTLTDTTASYEAEIVALTGGYEHTIATQRADYETTIADLTDGYETELADMETGYESEIADLKKGYENQIASLEDGYETTIAQQTADYQDTIAGQQESYEATIAGQKERYETTIARQKDDYETQVAALESDLSLTHQYYAGLEDQVGTLENALARALDSGEALARQRDQLEGQLGTLESLIADMRDQQQELVDRVVVRTLDNITDLEDLVASTGLDVEYVLGKVEGYGIAQGGPFIPADEMLDDDASYELQVSVAMLDLRLDRWDALNLLVNSLPMATPMERYEITSDFGYRRDPINGRSALHTGVDFGAPRNTPLYTTGPGVVTFAGWRGRYGRVVEVDHGFGIKTRFAHLAKISVKKGQEVALGEELGLLGTSGRSTGPHVHYEVLFEGKPYDPMNFIKAGKDVF